MTAKLLQSKIDSFSDFTKLYGTNTTTNFELMKWSKDLGMPKVYVLMKNELDDLERLKQKLKTLYIICNYQTTDEVGIHWTCMYRTKDISFYFDSFGIVPLKEANDFLNTKERYYNSFKIQKSNTKYCGQLCLWILFQLHLGKDFIDIILSLKNELQ